MFRYITLSALLALTCSGEVIAQNSATRAATPSPAASVNPLIGSSNGGNTFPGAMLPFGMLQWSPENTRGKHNHTAAPGGYLFSTTRIRGFSPTHLSGTGCAGASGDVQLETRCTAVSPASTFRPANRPTC